VHVYGLTENYGPIHVCPEGKKALAPPPPTSPRKQLARSKSTWRRQGQGPTPRADLGRVVTRGQMTGRPAGKGATNGRGGFMPPVDNVRAATRRTRRPPAPAVSPGGWFHREHGVLRILTATASSRWTRQGGTSSSPGARTSPSIEVEGRRSPPTRPCSKMRGHRDSRHHGTGGRAPERAVRLPANRRRRRAPRAERSSAVSAGMPPRPLQVARTRSSSARCRDIDGQDPEFRCCASARIGWARKAARRPGNGYKKERMCLAADWC